MNKEKNTNNTENYQINQGSFRDPAGFVFFQNNVLYRQINKTYAKDYDLLINSGLYQRLVELGLIVVHKEVDIKYAKSDKAYKIIRPEVIPFISYPYEWSFSQLKDAALLTLKIQKLALKYGMSLKDCSAYNVQFKDCKPKFIDTLSFEKYSEDKSWVAQYRQFSRHFLAPLALMHSKDARLNQLLRIFIDGIPLDLASKLLSNTTYLKPSLFFHIHISSWLQKFFTEKPINAQKFKQTKKDFLKLLDKLESAIKKMTWRPKNTEWGDYYSSTNYINESFNHKKQIINEFLTKINPKHVIDLGANTGIFSHIAGNKGIQTMALDCDPAAVEKNYLECVKNNKTNILPLLLDLTNPSSSIGWANKERMSFLKRNPTDNVMALALIHHLAISNNLPLHEIAKFFNDISKSIIIEFVPKSDSQVKKLLSRREDIFPDYKQEIFEKEFKKYFEILDSKQVKESERILYLMKKKHCM